MPPAEVAPLSALRQAARDFIRSQGLRPFSARLAVYGAKTVSEVLPQHRAALIVDLARRSAPPRPKPPLDLAGQDDATLLERLRQAEEGTSSHRIAVCGCRR